MTIQARQYNPTIPPFSPPGSRSGLRYVDVAAAAGLSAAKQSGNEVLYRCPFHEDHEPSLVITPAKNLWHCLGACRAGGSVIDWLMKARGVSFPHAVELLRADHPSLATGARIVRKATTAAVKLEAPFAKDEYDQRVLRQVVDYYHETLKQSPETLKYLQSRGLELSHCCAAPSLQPWNRHNLISFIRLSVDRFPGVPSSCRRPILPTLPSALYVSCSELRDILGSVKMGAAISKSVSGFPACATVAVSQFIGFVGR